MNKRIINKIMKYFNEKGIECVFEKEYAQINVKFAKIPNSFVFNFDDEDRIVWYGAILETNQNFVDRARVEKELVKADSVFDLVYWFEEDKTLHLRSVQTENRVIKMLDQIYDEMEKRTNPVSDKYLKMGE